MTTIDTERLQLRPWQDGDAAAALSIFGAEDVARWLTPAMSRVPDEDTMRSVLRRWRADDAEGAKGVGHWAVELKDRSRLVGGLELLYLPPWNKDLEIAWQLAPSAWGHGYAAEAGEALAHWAMHHAGVEEVYAIVRPENTKGAATAQRIGMEWLGETQEYHQMHLQLYRLRHSDLGYTEE